MQENKEISAFIEDIRYIREKIQKNSGYVQLIYQTWYIRWTSILSGLSIIVFSLLHYYHINLHGSYSAIPEVTRNILLWGFILTIVLAGFLKLPTYFIMKKDYPKLPAFSIFVRIFGASVLLSYTVIGFIMLFLIVYFGLNGHWHMIVPTIAMGTGLIFFISGSGLKLWDVMLMGAWQIIPGTVSIPFIASAPGTAFLWLAGTMGLGFFTYGLTMQIRAMLKKR